MRPLCPSWDVPRQWASSLALPGGAPEQSRKHNTSIATVVRGGMGHGVGKLLVICGIGNWLGTCDVAVPMSASDTAHSIALHPILHLKAGVLTPVGAMKHFPPLVRTNVTNTR